MPAYEYKVVPAPTKGVKAPGVKTAEARFSHAIQVLMNAQAAEGWEYQRAETLPSTERAGLTGTTVEYRNVLIFRRLRENDAETFTPELLPPPSEPDPAPQEARSTPAELPAEPALRAPETAASNAVQDAPAEPQMEPETALQERADLKSLGMTIQSFASTRTKAKTDI